MILYPILAGEKDCMVSAYKGGFKEPAWSSFWRILGGHVASNRCKPGRAGLTSL
jgi:hypothetical protein